jgi:hypothetical protein
MVFILGCELFSITYVICYAMRTAIEVAMERNSIVVLPSLALDAELVISVVTASGGLLTILTTQKRTARSDIVVDRRTAPCYNSLYFTANNIGS